MLKNKNMIPNKHNQKMKYDYNMDFNDINSQPYNIAKFIKPKSRVLDIGCSAGRLGKYLREQLHCYVIGIDINPEYRSLCEKNLDEFYILDVNNFNLLEDFLKDRNFDFVILADILEHLIDADGFLRKLSNLLSKNEHAILSIPNISFWEARLRLLLGIFEYKEAGIFDRTHLHFYNLYYARKILTCNFDIIDEAYSSWYLPLEKLLHLRKIPIVKKYLYYLRRFLTSILPNLYASQLIFLLKSDKIN